MDHWRDERWNGVGLAADRCCETRDSIRALRLRMQAAAVWTRPARGERSAWVVHRRRTARACGCAQGPRASGRNDLGLTADHRDAGLQDFATFRSSDTWRSCMHGRAWQALGLSVSYSRCRACAPRRPFSSFGSLSLLPSGAFFIWVVSVSRLRFVKKKASFSPQ